MTKASAPPSSLNPQEYEPEIYQKWITARAFSSPAPGGTPFSVLLPPPNVTSNLHMGHGLNHTLQDILVRFHRMLGDDVAWIPGVDHAGIATQMMVERELNAQGLRKEDLGRDAFVQRCKEWKEAYGGVITEQMRRMGSSCDWDRLAYSMSPELSRAVREIFVRLFEDDLIYQGDRLVNWDPVLQTALSDDEVTTEEQHGFLWTFAFHLASGHERVLVSTTRPETTFGDVCLAVHPDDPRYHHLVGQEVVHPITRRRLPVIADTYVKPEFGTGVVKITPAHDFNDFELGRRHGFTPQNVMNPDGSLNDACPEPFRGLGRDAARRAVVAALEATGNLIETKPHPMAVPVSERSKAVIEPRVSRQWFLRMRKLAEPALAAAKNDELLFFPESWKKTYIHWLESVQDWCISRQLWWGHRLPVWTCGRCAQPNTGRNDPTECASCGSDELSPSQDVLDTWFSSWLWPFSTLGWPDETSDLERYFPSAVLVTGPDILYLWVARMVMASYYTRGKLCFGHVVLNALVCDKQGRKFSKTLGNGIDPLEMIASYGADAVRYTCVALAPIGGRVRMDRSDFAVGHRFVHKLWNASRFTEQFAAPYDLAPFVAADLACEEAWLLHQLREAVSQCREGWSQYRIGDAVQTLYHFAWNSLCDWGLEAAKHSPRPEQTASVLVYAMQVLMRAFSPVMPFIAEKIAAALPKHPQLPSSALVMTGPYPDPTMMAEFPQQAAAWSLAQALTTAVRSLRTQSGIANRDKLEATIWLDPARHAPPSDPVRRQICQLAGLSELTLAARDTRPGMSLCVPGPGWTVYLPVAGLIDLAAERARLGQEEQRITGVVRRLEAKLAGEKFRDRAPPDVVASTVEQLENMGRQLTVVRCNLAALSAP